MLSYLLDNKLKWASNEAAVAVENIMPEFAQTD
jgi:hypothetical protein